LSTLRGKPLNDVRCKISKLYAMFFENHMKEIFRLPWQSQLSAEYNYFSDFVEVHARNTLSFIQFGQVGKKKMFKKMFDARWTLSVTIAHVDSFSSVF